MKQPLPLTARWKPREAFLYDGWPFRHRRRLMERIAEAEVKGVGP